MVRINLILNEPWTPELTNENSEPYNKLASTWRGEITQIFANFPGQKVVTILKFSEAVSSSKTLVTMDLSLNDGDDSKDDLEKMKYSLKPQMLAKGIDLPQNWWRLLAEPGELKQLVKISKKNSQKIQSLLSVAKLNTICLLFDCLFSFFIISCELSLYLARVQANSTELRARFEQILSLKKTNKSSEENLLEKP